MSTTTRSDSVYCVDRRVGSCREEMAGTVIDAAEGILQVGDMGGWKPAADGGLVYHALNRANVRMALARLTGRV